MSKKIDQKKKNEHKGDQKYHLVLQIFRRLQIFTNFCAHVFFVFDNPIKTQLLRLKLCKSLPN
jgi:hypothetical protein